MKILLIGKSGQIGNSIDMLAPQRGHAIHSYLRSELEITNTQKLDAAIEKDKPDVVINASGYHVIPDCEKFPEEAFRVNAIAVRELAILCEKKGIRMINYSTDKVFDGKKGKLYEEDDPTGPLQMYGISKLAGELVSHDYCYGAITIRTCGVFGGTTGSRIKKGNFVLYIINQAKQTKKLEISLEQISNFAYADDLGRATLELLEKNAESGIYHIVNTGYAPWATFAQEIVKQSKVDLEIVPVDRSGVYSDIRNPIFSALDNNKVRSLGIDLPTWQDGLKRYLAYLQTHND